MCTGYGFDTWRVNGDDWIGKELTENEFILAVSYYNFIRFS